MRGRIQVRLGETKRLGIGAGALLVGATLCAQPPSGAPTVPKVTGNSAPNALGLGLIESPVAQGSQKLENPTAAIGFYGYDANGPMLPAPGDVQAPGHNVEATKTEPDKNTYLVLHDLTRRRPELRLRPPLPLPGPRDRRRQGYVTRINLDADAAHRVTLFATEDSTGEPLPPIDGSTWDPWAQRLLFTAEDGADGGVWQSTLDFPPVVEDLLGILGRGGYEGIQNDSDGNLWIVEDVGGAKGTVNSTPASRTASSSASSRRTSTT